MSRHHKFRSPQSAQLLPAEGPGAAVTMAPDGPADHPPEAATLVVGPPPPAAGEIPCPRLLMSDSLRWTCACGASGRVSRTPDGIPYLDAELVRHSPGETKEGA